MDSVGVRDLKQHTIKILRRVRDRGETIDVTYRGRVVARLVPAEQRAFQEMPISKEELDAFWRKWDRLAEEIGEGWPEGVSAVDAVNDVRRDL